MRVNYAMVFVSDMKRSVSFYRDVLELPMRFESAAWTEFATEGATLALHVEASAAGRHRPGLSVANLDAFHAKMVERGVRSLQAPKSVFGIRVAQYIDPDGLTISVGEQD